MIKTKITEMLGIQHPIIQGGMHFVGFAELAAAVSNAGGLGIITGLTQKTPADLANEIARCKDMTDKPFGVNVTFLPSLVEFDYPAIIKAIIDGFECGGHPGEDDIPNMILLPRASDELEIPFVSSGGQADGRSLVASLAMGAEGMNMGTRFMATQEAPIHENVKQAILDATELDTRLVMRPLRNTERVLNNAATESLLAKEKELGDKLTFEDIADEKAGVYPRIMLDGDIDSGAWSYGMVVGLINDIPTVRELIDRTMEQARTIIDTRLSGILQPNG